VSLATVAATVQPDPLLHNLPASRPERFQRSDFIAAGLVFLVTLGVYIATLAPNVTLEDSGELITAAAKFGVGHPPGYPLWTMSGFLLSHILPFGGLAWRMNLLCALFGALSNAILTLLVCHSGRWLLQRWTSPEIQPVVRPYVFYVGLFAGLTIGFSDVMWSQAVISAVHGTLNALFVNAVLLLFYLWMLEPQKSHRLILAVFVFSLGLTNHHTLVQIIPAFLIAAGLLQFTPFILKKTPHAPLGTFFSVFIAVCLFSLSILVYISWLSGDNELQTISQSMAWMILILTAVVSFFYLKEFRLKLFLLGAATALVIFSYGYYLLDPGENNALRYTAATAPHFWLWGSFVHPGWLQGLVANARAGHALEPRQISPGYALALLVLTAAALGLLYSSSLNRRMIIGVFVVGWLGLVPYSYERFASTTHPPMNWGIASERSGFYYEVSREQYPKSLPTLIKTTFGMAIGIVSRDAQLDTTIGLPDYFPRLGKTFYYYGDNLQQNFTVPLIFLTLALLLYFRRLDWPQVNWLIFLGAAFFLLGFMLLIIAPQEGFDFERNLQYKVFHLQSHCIFVILMGYGLLAMLTYLHEIMPEIHARFGVAGAGFPALFLSLLPLWSNFDGCSQAGHWFGYNYGADMMRDMDRNAVYFGGSDPGRFVPTYMAFVESQQDPRWKREHDFDRRDVSVITQNALCDTYYAQYIRDQYDARFRPKPDEWTSFERWLGRDRAYPEQPVACVSHDELVTCWEEYQKWPEVESRVEAGGPILRPGTTDVFDINGIVAQKIFEKNKKNHTFYLEQSTPIQWMYPYMLPSGLIFKLNTEPLVSLPASAVEEDRKFWDSYSARLLQNPRFRLDPDAILTFGKLAFWHADLYRWRHLEKEQEYWLRMALTLCPQLQDAVNSLSNLLKEQQRYDEAITVVEQAEVADPRNDAYGPILDWLKQARVFGKREQELRAQLGKSPYDVQLNLELARLLQDEGNYPELNDRLRTIAGLTNWDHTGMADIIQYYVDKVHNPNAAIAFLEARAKIDPKASALIYSLAALHSSVGHKDEAIKDLTQAAALGGTNALISAKIDPRFAGLRDDPRFQALVSKLDSNQPAINKPGTNAPSTNTTTEGKAVVNPPVVKVPKEVLSKPVKK
jgi:tetratricopeptide (TPR) repeat protein